MGTATHTSDRGALIPQPKCKDCGKDWGMYENEVQFFKDLQKTNPEIQLPKRCPDCRKKKKINDLSQVVHNLEAMAEKSRTEAFYTYKEDLLADELEAQINILKRYIGAKG